MKQLRCFQTNAYQADQAELAVHKKKIEDVRRWLQEALDETLSAKVRKYKVSRECAVVHTNLGSLYSQRILVLSGIAGIGKTAALRVLSRELGFKIEEWKNSQDDAHMDEDYGVLDRNTVLSV